jgi:hypothetical protein
MDEMVVFCLDSAVDVAAVGAHDSNNTRGVNSPRDDVEDLI